jgi:hypothetical protein
MCCVDGFDNISHQRNIDCIQYHLSKKDGAITKKKVSIAQFSINITMITEIHDFYHLKSFLS